MGPLRDGKLLWSSKECLPRAIACRERFFLHKRLQSTPFPRQYISFMLRRIGHPNLLQSKPVVPHLQNDSQQYRRHYAPCSFWAPALETLTWGSWAANRAPLALRCHCHSCLFHSSQVCPLDCQHMYLCGTFREIVEDRQHLGDKSITDFSVAASLYWYTMNP